MMFLWSLIVLFLGASLASPTNSKTGMKASKVIATHSKDQCCGTNYPLIQSRIIGGFEVPPHSIPYQVLIQTGTLNITWCGGSLISDRFVLTAAHCLEDKSNIGVVVGEHDLLDLTDGQQIILPSNVFIHPNYEHVPKKVLNYDFAIIELKEAISLRPEVGIACLPMNTAETFVNANLIASGWGRTDIIVPFSPVLKAMRTRGISNEECLEILLDSFEDKLCALSSKYSSVYKGDSGGPLTAVVDGKATVVGVTSYGATPFLFVIPQVFARVTHALQWILDTTDAADWQC